MNRPTDSARRRVLRASLSLAATGLLGPWATPSRAAVLRPTPAQTPGPFYPQDPPLDDDNDLVRVRGRPGLAQGRITHLAGRVMDDHGRPLRGADVQIWQCDANGRYHHPRDRRDAPRDENFQGFGRAATGDGGAYRFRTIRPVPYPGRTPHVHFAVLGPGFEPFVTQMYVAGEPGNETDFILNSVRDPALRASLIVALEPVPDSPGELAGQFDIVLAADGRSGVFNPR